MKFNKKVVAIILAILILASSILLYFFLTKKEKNNNDKAPKPEIKEEVSIVDVNSTTRPYAVMINNVAQAREVQTGLNDAYITYEIIVEGGITRFMALFKDVEDVKMASVRSSRHYYLDYAMENDAFYVHWGWSPQAQSDISSLGINNINGLTYEGKYFLRQKDTGLAYEHTGYTTSTMLDQAVEKIKYRNELEKDLLLNYSATSINYNELDEVKTANEIDIKYSQYITSSYKYDETTKLYNRYINGKEHLDGDSNEQITAKNIIVYQVENNTIPGDEKGRQDLENIGEGKGYLISEGNAIAIKWKKSNRSSQTIYTYENSEEIVVNDGNTFIQIYPDNGKLTIN